MTQGWPSRNRANPGLDDSIPLGLKNRALRQVGSQGMLCYTPMSKRAIAHLSSDPVMSALIEKIGIIHLRPRRLPPFQSLAHAIIHQQLNSNAAGTILERFKGLFPDDDFPTPGQVAKASVDRLRTAGLSRPKAAYIIELAKRCNASLIPGVNDCDSCHENPRPVRTGCRKVIINLAELPPTEAGLQGRPRI